MCSDCIFEIFKLIKIMAKKNCKNRPNKIPTKKITASAKKKLKFKKKTVNSRKRRNSPLISQMNDEAKEPIYKSNDWNLLLVGLYQVFEQINAQFKLPDNFIFDTIALIDEYLKNCNKYLNLKDMVKILYACIDILAKEQNLKISFKEFFKGLFDLKVEFDIFEVVNCKIYPEKMYDYFSKFYYQFIHEQNQNDDSLKVFKAFKHNFMFISFIILFNNNSLSKNHLMNFIYSLLLTLEKTKEVVTENIMDILEKRVYDFIKEYKYSNTEYMDFKLLFTQSMNHFNYLYNKSKH